MQHPHSCPECGHAVFSPLIAPVGHPQVSCRAVLAGKDGARCGCRNAAHRTPALRPRHRLEVVRG